MENAKTATQDKIRSMAGFAFKSRRIEIGTDRILKKNSASQIVFVDTTLSENAIAKIKRGCEATNKILISANFDKQFDFYIPGCKAFGLTDRNMCESIRAELTEDNQNYLVLLGGGRLG